MKKKKLSKWIFIKIIKNLKNWTIIDDFQTNYHLLLLSLFKIIHNYDSHLKYHQVKFFIFINFLENQDYFLKEVN